MDTSQVTDMSRMFLNCSSLKELNLSHFDTNKVEDMSFMFGGCSGLTTLNLKNFDTSRVTNMNGMFSGCDTLEKLDLSDFDTSNVKNMSKIFDHSDSIKSLNLGEKFVVPENQAEDTKLADKTWINIGTGTETNPKPTDKKGINSVQLLSEANKGNWVVKPESAYVGPFTVKIPNNIDGNLEVAVPTKDQPEYIGSSFDVEVPEKVGYKADKHSVTVTATKTGILTSDLVMYTPIEKPVQESKQPVMENKPVTEAKTASEPVIAPTQESSVSESTDSVQQEEPKAVTTTVTEPETKPEPTVQPKFQGEITNVHDHVTVHPDLKTPKVFNSKGELINGCTLNKDHSWLSTKKLTLGDVQYYLVEDDKWVKTNEVYLYENVRDVVRTKNIGMTTLFDSHAKAIMNRGLGASSSWKSDRLVTLKGHKYYRISMNEFVIDSDVDVIE